MLWFNVKPSTFRLIHYVYIGLSLYLVCGLLRYYVVQYCKNRKHIQPCCKNTNTNQPSFVKSVDVKRSNSRKTILRQTSRGMQNRHNKFVKSASTLMAILSLLVGIVTFVHILLDLWVFSVNNRFSLNMLCIRQKWSGVLLFLSVLCVYLFLWIRQRIFYSHPVLRNLSKPMLNRFSWSVLFAIIFSITTFSIAYYVIPSDLQLDSDKLGDNEYYVFYNDSTWKVFSFRHNNEKAESKSNSSTMTDQHHTCTFKSKSLFLLSHVVITVTFLYFQISLQLLFAYPVMKSRRNRKRLLRRYDMKNKASKREDKPVLKPKSSEILLLAADSHSSSIAANSYHTSSSKKCRKHTGVCAGSFKNTSSKQTALRQSCSDSSLKTLKQRSVNNNDVIFTELEKQEKKRKSNGNIPDISNNLRQQAVRISSSSDSKLSSPKHSDSSWNKGSFSEVSCTCVQKQKRPKKRKVSRYIWRCFVVSLICCLTDVAAFGFNAYTQVASSRLYITNPPDALRENTLHFSKHNFNETSLVIEERVTISLLSVMAYNGNMIVNLLCMILCYDKYMAMLLPCFVYSRKVASHNDQ